MNKVTIVYDDTRKPTGLVESVLKNRHYGDIIIRRLSLTNKMLNIFQDISCIQQVEVIKSYEDCENLTDKLGNQNIRGTIIHMYSNMAVKNVEIFKVLIEQLSYAKNPIKVVIGKQVAMIVYPDVSDYLNHLKLILNRDIKLDFLSKDSDAIIDISNYLNFSKYITNAFDARHFNSVSGEAYTVTKASTNIEKIKKEYYYYQLISENMKRWMVMPYNLEIDEEFASYQMERLYIPDVALRWTHFSIDEQEFKDLMNHILVFVNERDKKYVNPSLIQESLYKNKVRDRIQELKKMDAYPQLAKLIEAGTTYRNIDEIYEVYEKLFDANKHKINQGYLAVGHGDLCFSNMLYNHNISMIKFIDPKGALEEDDLWMCPYYDIAKLSHSIVGMYDFFNTGQYQINLTSNEHFTLTIDCENKFYKEHFKNILEQNGFDYHCVRICEASLFISMLPLHIDNPNKVFGLILNAIKILEELV